MLLILSPFRLVVLLALCALVAACGGDGATADASAVQAGANAPAPPTRTYTGPDAADIQRALRARLDSTGTGGPLSGEALEAVRRVYRARDYRPIWTGSSEGLGRAAALLEAVAEADRHALDPAVYDLRPVDEALRAAYPDAPDGDPAADSFAARRADADLLLSRLFLSYGRDLARGPFRPSDVGADWYVEEAEPDVEGALGRAADGDVRQTLTRLASTHQSYRALQGALERYREIAASGGFPRVPEGDVVEVGERSPRVPALRRRLAAEMDGVAPSGDSLLDRRLASDLARFQAQHGLAVDSVLGPNTVAALNTSVEQRIRQIEANLVRWQWLPTDLGGRYVLVNLPEYRLHAYDGGDEVLQMGVVVGAEYDDRATPVFSDVIEYAEFRPYWNVPPSIAEEELVPKGPGWLDRNGFEIVRYYGAEDALPMTAANLRQVAQGDYRLRETPGDDNALGLVKYMFPNDYAIYLHDTPADHLFDRRERAFSHGCIRVEDPPALGAFVFADRGWTGSDIQQRMQNAGPSTRVDVQDPIPVYILYLTAFVDDGGTLNFRDDLYGYDEPLVERLASRSVGEPEVDVARLVDRLPR